MSFTMVTYYVDCAMSFTQDDMLIEDGKEVTEMLEISP